ncbi:hypothetical protein N7509_000329 [Penicillium cosmopolitanum]|uniref:Zn(2)-C6 fungal-type domain-containing protein n=1 Tax=Penicillium cosmopolitanum TaxID=1131564 RepID=A0A9X0BDZ6_9EURO|nr:uncharacterized protein N7509_000329 [Penicillium cosmopolitanum]KAJ5413702.1 hypothetical protein N7509_000329 [Penicillium cosmopolitanum]
MPCRRSHKKSRNGCNECKKRRVKCDEQVPKCTFCNSRQFKCVYTRLSPRGQIQEGHLQDPSHQNQHELSSAREKGALQLDTRLVEANLLHHYYTDTSMTQSDKNDSSYQFWHFTVPKIATRESFALDSILAFTALHMAYSESNQRSFWITTGLSYNDRACSKLSKMVGRMSAATLESALVCSIFITLFVIARHQFSAPSSYLCEAMSIKGLIQGCAIFYDKAKLLEPRHASSANTARESGSSKHISPNISREQHADSRLH